MKTIVVTGSEGFIGRNLIKLLLKNGYKIISIDEIKRKRKNKFNCTQLNSIKSFFNKKKKFKKNSWGCSFCCSFTRLNVI
tara:strand:- start:796 stop:1035 length:240 start_codon:yes stop_codon:yes gene_type:complete